MACERTRGQATWPRKLHSSQRAELHTMAMGRGPCNPPKTRVSVINKGGGACYLRVYVSVVDIAYYIVVAVWEST